MLSCAVHEKSFITSGPGLSISTSNYHIASVKLGSHYPNKDFPYLTMKIYVVGTIRNLWLGDVLLMSTQNMLSSTRKICFVSSTKHPI